MYSKEWIKKYNKTWYYKITINLRQTGRTPKKVVSGRPLRIFKRKISWIWIWKIAKPTYEWNILEDTRSSVAEPIVLTTETMIEAVESLKKMGTPIHVKVYHYNGERVEKFFEKELKKMKTHKNVGILTGAPLVKNENVPKNVLRAIMDNGLYRDFKF